MNAISLFINVPIDLTINSIVKSIHFHRDEFLTGIRLVLNSTFFSFNDRIYIYKQIFGTPMGSPLFPAIFLNFRFTIDMWMISHQQLLSLISSTFSIYLIHFEFAVSSKKFVIKILLDNGYALSFIFSTIISRLKELTDL